MHPIRLSDQTNATATIATGEDGSGALQVVEGTRDLSISEPLGGESSDPTLGGTSCSQETFADSKGRIHPRHHRHSIPVTSKEVMKTISDGAASYITTKQQPGSSTSKIVDQALHVVQRQGSSGSISNNETGATTVVEMQHSSQSSCDTTNHSSSTNTTAQSTVDSSCHSNNSPMPTQSSNPVISNNPPPQDEPNCIAPALRKIAKKRRKEPGKDGMERSSFHHTKSSKEYLRKAQEALRMQQQQQNQPDTNCRVADSSKDLDGDSMHSPRTNFRILSQGNLSSGIGAPPFSRSQSCGSVLSGNKSTQQQNQNWKEEDTGSNNLGYEDPDAAAAKNALGYEDPDAGAASSAWAAPRRMGPARRRGSVTKYSLQAAQAAQKATERIMKLQGLNWGGTMGGSARNVATPKEASPARRAMTPTGRRPTPRDMEATSQQLGAPTGDQSQPMAPPVRRRSIPMDSLDLKNSSHHDTTTADVAMDMETTERSSNPYGYGDTGTPDTSKTSATESSPYGYETTTAPLAASNPYGYEDSDTRPQQPRRHPRARRRGSVTKFSLDAAQTVASSQPAPVLPSSQSGPDPLLPNGGDFVMALKPPAESRSKGYAPRNRRRDHDFEKSAGAQPLSRNNSGASDQALSPRKGPPRRSGSTRSASSRHLARFGAPSRSDSFISHGSTGSFEDDVDSLAPDMESLCSIHDRDLGTEFDLGGTAPPMSPLTPGLNTGSKPKTLVKTFSNKSDSGGALDNFLLERRKSLSERSNFPVVTIPNNSEFAILPFPTGNSDARSSARMPAPVRRAPSHSASGCKSMQTGPLPSSGSSESIVDAS